MTDRDRIRRHHLNSESRSGGDKKVNNSDGIFLLWAAAKKLKRLLKLSLLQNCHMG